MHIHLCNGRGVAAFGSSFSSLFPSIHPTPNAASPIFLSFLIPFSICCIYVMDVKPAVLLLLLLPWCLFFSHTHTQPRRVFRSRSLAWLLASGTLTGWRRRRWRREVAWNALIMTTDDAARTLFFSFSSSSSFSRVPYKYGSERASEKRELLAERHTSSSSSSSRYIYFGFVTFAEDGQHTAHRPINVPPPTAAETAPPEQTGWMGDNIM
jgi:hypothetical protein